MIYTKPMLDDCTIEFLRLTNRDNGYGVPTGKLENKLTHA